MVKFPLVIRLTTGGFHVKHHCLITEYMPLSVLHNSLYSYCCLQCLGNGSDMPPWKSALLALLHFETSYLHNVFDFFLITESVWSMN